LKATARDSAHSLGAIVFAPSMSTLCPRRQTLVHARRKPPCALEKTEILASIFADSLCAAAPAAIAELEA
jgi:hypothetical protein